MSASLEAVLHNVRIDISNFLDVKSMVHLSRTSRAFHGFLTHDAGRPYPKIKIIHFDTRDRSMWRDAEGQRIPDDETNHSDRITTLAMEALSSIHFPSLRSIKFSPYVYHRHGGFSILQDFKDDFADAFVDLVFGLGSAPNLEELLIDFVMTETAESISRITFETFVQNLAKCIKLRRLSVSTTNIGLLSGVYYYSNDVLLALVPAVKRGGSTLEDVKLCLGDQPVAEPTNKAQSEAAGMLFAAILRLKRLRKLILNFGRLTSPLPNAFVEAAGLVQRQHETLPWSAMEMFHLKCCNRSSSSILPPLGISLVLHLLGHSKNLSKLSINVPSECWDATGASALSRALSAKPQLRSLCLEFNGYRCPGGKCQAHILNYVRERESCSDNHIRITGLQRSIASSGFNEEEEFGRYHSKRGGFFPWDEDGTMIFREELGRYHGRGEKVLGQKCLSWDEDGTMKFKVKGEIVRRFARGLKRSRSW